MQTAIIAGRLGKDPNNSTTSSGKDVCNFSVAVDTWDGKEKGTQWWRVSLWGARGKTLSRYLRKGSCVTVSGTVSLEMYNGEPQLNLMANDVTLQGGNTQGDGQQGGSGGGSQGGSANYDDLDDDIPF